MRVITKKVAGPVLVGAAILLLMSSLPEANGARAATPPSETVTGSLLTCPDVDPNGLINITDILRVASRFGGGAHPLYDLNGDGVVNINIDILGTAGQFGQACPALDTQIAKATLATMPYLTLNVATLEAAGYYRSTTDVPDQGIHYTNDSLVDNVFNPEQPEGLVYNSTGNLAALFYVMAGDTTVGAAGVGWFGQPAHAEKCNIDLQCGSTPVTCGSTTCSWSGSEDPWHSHGNLCVILVGQPQAAAYHPLGGDADCPDEADNGCILPVLDCNRYYDPYGWMNHLWAHKLNSNGRFADCIPPATFSSCPD